MRPHSYKRLSVRYTDALDVLTGRADSVALAIERGKEKAEEQGIAYDELYIQIGRTMTTLERAIEVTRRPQTPPRSGPAQVCGPATNSAN